MVAGTPAAVNAAIIEAIIHSVDTKLDHVVVRAAATDAARQSLEAKAEDLTNFEQRLSRQQTDLNKRENVLRKQQGDATDLLERSIERAGLAAQMKAANDARTEKLAQRELDVSSRECAVAEREGEMTAKKEDFARHDNTSSPKASLLAKMSVQDYDHLMQFAGYIGNHQDKDCPEAWAKFSDGNPRHSGEDWKAFYEMRVAPDYQNKLLEDQQQHDLQERTQREIKFLETQLEVRAKRCAQLEQKKILSEQYFRSVRDQQDRDRYNEREELQGEICAVQKQFESYRRRALSLDVVKHDLEEALEDMKKREEELKQEAERQQCEAGEDMQAEKQTLQARIEELEAASKKQKLEFDDTLADMRKREVELEKDIERQQDAAWDVMQSNTAELDDQIKQLEEKCAGLEQQKVDSDKTLMDMKKREEELKCDVERQQSESRNAMQGEKKKLEARIKELEAEHEQQKVQHGATLADMKQEYEQLDQELERKAYDSRERAAESNIRLNEAKELESTVTEREKDVQEREAKAKERENGIARLQTSTLDIMLNAIEKDNEAFKQKIEVEERERVIVKRENEVASREQSVDVRHVDLTEREERLDSREQDVGKSFKKLGRDRRAHKEKLADIESREDSLCEREESLQLHEAQKAFWDSKANPWNTVRSLREEIITQLTWQMTCAKSAMPTNQQLRAAIGDIGSVEEANRTNARDALDETKSAVDGAACQMWLECQLRCIKSLMAQDAQMRIMPYMVWNRC